MSTETATTIRAFELPLQAIDAGGRDGWALLRACWRQAADLSNWAARELLRADVTRLPGMERLPPMAPLDLYALAFGRKKEKPRKRRRKEKGGPLLPAEGPPLPIVDPQYPWGGAFWAGATASAAAILHRVDADYRRQRTNVIWHGNRRPVEYVYPQPWPVPASCWKGCSLEQHTGKPWVEVMLPGCAKGAPLHLRLRGGPEFGRQMALFRQLVGGNFPRVELQIRQEGVSAGCHRPTGKDGGVTYRVMVKMVAHLPLPQKRGQRTLVLLTDPGAFWVAELDGCRAWVLNNDHMRRGVDGHAAHLARLQRLAQDAKAERRLRSNRTRYIQDRLDALCPRHERQMRSWTHESAAHLVSFASRQGVCEILYLDRDRGFIPRFPWSDLLGKLRDKCQASHIDLYSESGVVLRGGRVYLQTDSGPEPEPTENGEAGEVNIQPSEEDSTWLRIVRLREMATRRVLAARRRCGSHPKVCVP